ncbi:hypothetical protein [Mycobacterium sp.]|uniref:hypothetical protein n=1 Tax=Mycobacterium sp. TaxID=1785 RepID=UPI003F9E2275
MAKTSFEPAPSRLSPEPVQLAIVGSGQVTPLMRFVPAAASSVVELCSVLVVRH